MNKQKRVRVKLMPDRLDYRAKKRMQTHSTKGCMERVSEEHGSRRATKETTSSFSNNGIIL